METSNNETHRVVEFFGQKIFTSMDAEGWWHVALKPISDGIGLDWRTQQRKLKANKQNLMWDYKTMIAGDGKQYDMVVLYDSELTAWLDSVNPNKLTSYETIEMLKLYQDELFHFLNYFWQEELDNNCNGWTQEEEDESLEFLKDYSSHELTQALVSEQSPSEIMAAGLKMFAQAFKRIIGKQDALIW
ncbi:phage antirepressor N-terminal domain-containing protein [Thermodesulfobacteriota bacterium]